MIIRFNVPVGEEVQHVILSLPLGAGGDSWDININNYFCGSVIKKGDKWKQLHINRHEFTSDDIDAIGERIDEYLISINPA